MAASPLCLDFALPKLVVCSFQWDLFYLDVAQIRRVRVEAAGYFHLASGVLGPHVVAVA